MIGLSSQDAHLTREWLEEIDSRLRGIGADLRGPGGLCEAQKQAINKGLFEIAIQVRRLRGAIYESTMKRLGMPGVWANGTEELREQW